MLQDLPELMRRFVWVCWRRGIGTAWRMASERVALIRLFRRRGSFPDIRSNVSSYVHLLARRPRVSIVMPVRHAEHLEEAVRSVIQQSYDVWQLILVDDASSPHTADTCRALAAENNRIKLIRSESQLGISGATNRGIQEATGDYVAFMDHDDLLHPDALALWARTINEDGEADFFYTDEIRMSQEGVALEHMQKCAVSETLLFSCNAVLHLCIVRRARLAELGGLNSDYDGAQDHDLVLRAFERGFTFRHIPLPLYAWRIHDASASADARRPAHDAWPKAYLSGKACVEAYIARKGIKARVVDDGYPWYRVHFTRPDPPPPVALVVPFKDQVEHLQRLLQSLEQTAYPNYSLYLVNNRSELEATRTFVGGLQSRPRVQILDHDEAFNYSRLHNKVVAGLKEDIIVFLNSDIEALHPEWLEAMLEHIQRDGVAIVGARLERADGRLQHAGITLQAWNHQPCAANIDVEDSYFTRVQREVSGVSGACMMIRKQVCQHLGGFDEVNFPIGFSDVDLCLRARAAGHRIIYTPYARLRHAESASRGVTDERYEEALLRRRLLGAGWRDPHYRPLP